MANPASLTDQLGDVRGKRVLVRSDLKGRGVGWTMLEKACGYARDHGYERAECVESSENQRAIALEREQGYVARLHSDDAELTILTKILA